MTMKITYVMRLGFDQYIAEIFVENVRVRAQVFWSQEYATRWATSELSKLTRGAVA